MWITALTFLRPFLPWILAAALGAGGMYWWMEDRVDSAKNEYSNLKDQYELLNKLHKAQLESIALSNKEQTERAVANYKERIRTAEKEIKNVRSELNKVVGGCPVTDDINSLLDSASGVSSSNPRIP